MRFRSSKAGNWLGFVSVVLCIVPLTYVARPAAYPETSLTEAIVLIGGAGGSLPTALSAGVIGSRWWFVAALGSALDVACIWGFSP